MVFVWVEVVLVIARWDCLVARAAYDRATGAQP